MASTYSSWSREEPSCVIRFQSVFGSCMVAGPCLKVYGLFGAAHYQRPNYAHKLTKAAGPLARRPSRLGRLELHARGTAAAVRSRHCVLVAAAAAPLSGAGT